MLSGQDNDFLCRVGPGTPMGNLMREYWLPVLRSSELLGPDCNPVRVRLLGENLIAFRDTSGRVGLLADRCSHRGLSLFYGRNEQGGLRCVYHGWKYDVDGHCLETPNEPDGSAIREKISHLAYPCQERGGAIWTYMGSREQPPSLAGLPPTLLPIEQANVGMTFRDCNWMQALEGDIDTSHASFLHYGPRPYGHGTENSVDGASDTRKAFDAYRFTIRNPKYSVLPTDYGVMYGAYRPASEDTYYWRVAHFLFPVFTMVPVGVLGEDLSCRAWVPMDDEHTMSWTFSKRGAGSRGDTPRFERDERDPMLPNTDDWFGRWRPASDRTNDFFLDRDIQRNTESYTGLIQQDKMATEGMGPMADRSNEHLGIADSMIIQTRKRLIEAARALADGAPAPAVDTPGVYSVRSGGVVLKQGADWLEETNHLRNVPVESLVGSND